MGIRNTLGDMHNILMEQLERLNDATEGEVDQEIQRSKAMSDVATSITNNAKTMVLVIEKTSIAGVRAPRMLTDGEA